MFKRILYTALLCIIAIGFSTTKASAQKTGLQIGYVDPQAVLSKMPQMKAVQQRLQNFVEKKRKTISQKQQDFQKQVSEYQQKEAVLSDASKKSEQERLGKLNAQLQQFQAKLQKQVQDKQQELVSPLLDQIDTAVSAVAKRKNLTYVLNTTTSQGDVIILYASDEAKAKYDITEQVMNELDI